MPLNPFSADAIAKSVHKTLDEAMVALPEGKKHALLIDASTDNGVKAVYVSKIDDKWQIALETGYDGHAAHGRVATALVW